jgi:hypothetical protein
MITVIAAFFAQNLEAITVALAAMPAVLSVLVCAVLYLQMTVSSRGRIVAVVKLEAGTKIFNGLTTSLTN